MGQQNRAFLLSSLLIAIAPLVCCGCWYPGFLWNLPGLKTVYGLNWLSEETEFSRLEILNLYLHDRITVGVSRDFSTGYFGFCAQIECGPDCDRFIRGEEFPGGNAGIACMHDPVPLYPECPREHTRTTAPIHSTGSWSKSMAETDYYKCGDHVLILHDAYLGD